MRIDKRNKVRTDTLEKQGFRQQHPELWQDARFQSVQVMKIL